MIYNLEAGQRDRADKDGETEAQMESDWMEGMMEKSKSRVGSFAPSFIHSSKGTFMSTYYMRGIELGKGTIKMRREHSGGRRC